MSRISITIPADLGRTYDAALLERSARLLSQCFGDDLTKVLPQQVTTAADLEWIVDTAARFESLRGCQGFSKHVALYADGKDSATFVAQLAASLVTAVDVLELEPDIPGRSARGDLRIDYQGQELFLECKNPGSQHDQDLLDDHLRIARQLLHVVPSGSQVDVWYTEQLSDEAWDDLGKSIASRVAAAAAPGALIDNSTVRVQLTRLESGTLVPPPAPGLEMTVGGLAENLLDHEVVLFHALCTNQRTIGLYGPSVNHYEKTLERCMQASRSQAPVGRPYVLVVSSGFMTGKLAENVRKLNTRFQPDQNTRFSAVMLLNTIGPTSSVHIATNPFAEQPLPQNVVALLQRLNGVRMRDLTKQ